MLNRIRIGSCVARVLLASAVTLSFCSTANSQTTIRVPINVPTIQAAIVAAQDGDTVLVAPGTYFENIDFLGKAILVASESGPNVTVIDGGNVDSAVKFQSEETVASVLRGFTIQHGGVTNFGGGILMLRSSPRITGNIFDSNTAFGAAIWGNVSSPIIEANLFRNNTCDDQFLSGVVSFVNSSSPEIVNNVFTNNPCRAINMTLPTDTVPHVSNNTIVGNRGGIKVGAQVSTALHLYRNNIIVGNDIGLQVDFSGSINDPTWKSNLVFGNLNDYVGISNQTGINGNISADPLFTSATAGDYHLQNGSPAIDAGDSSSPALPDKDFDGNPRILDGNGDGIAVINIGAYEVSRQAPVFLVDSFQANLVIDKRGTGKDRFFAEGSFRLGVDSNQIDLATDKVTISLSDADGKFFQQTLPGGSFQSTGQNNFIFRASAGSSGVRLFTVDTGKKQGQIEFKVLSDNVELSGADRSLVILSLQIGDDAGNKDLTCRISPEQLKCR